jgi:type IV pilus assembly protein PilA
VLAAISIPAYQSYTVRAQVTEGLNLADAMKTSVAEYYAQTGQLPNSNKETGLPVAPISGKYAKSVAVQGHGQIMIQFDPALQSIGGKTLMLSPLINAQGDIAWQCSSNDLADRYLPAACRSENTVSRLPDQVDTTKQ